LTLTVVELIEIVLQAICLTGDIPRDLLPEARRLVRIIILGATLIFVGFAMFKLSASS
jgi:hypothetical protein